MTLSAPTPTLPFSMPDAVKSWVKREDWEALSRAWAAAEAQAIAWAEGEGDDLEEDDDDVWDIDSEISTSLYTSDIVTTTITSSGIGRRRRPRRPKWDEDFSLVGIDSRKPPPLRRYFDSVPAEISPPVQAVRRELRPKPALPFRSSVDDEAPTDGREPWMEAWGSTASTDNDGLHPHLRHYFGNRGMEASYRQRPHIDCKWLQEMKPRTPGRPSTKEKLERWRSASEPALSSASPGKGKKEKVVIDAGTRGLGSIHWGNRCLMYGPDGQVKTGPNGEQIPWVYDHHVSETEDNEIMHPLLRHYFDRDGVESSFRNRGRHYGRDKKLCFGLPSLPQSLPSPQGSPQNKRQPSIRSASQGSLHPSQQSSQFGSRQGSAAQPSSFVSPSRLPSQAASPPTSRHTSAPASQHSRRSFRPSVPHSRNPSIQMPTLGSWPVQLVPSQPSSLPSVTPMGSRQSSLQPSRRPSMQPCAHHRVVVGSPIPSLAGSIAAS